MSGSRGLWKVLIAIAVFAPVLNLPAAPDRKTPVKDQSPEFRTAKRLFVQKSRSRQPSDRAAAVGELGKVPGRAAAELLWQSALNDDSVEVRQAAVELLAAWRDQPEVSQPLLDLLTKTTRKSGMDQRTYGVLKAFGPTENSDLQVALLKYLDEFLGAPKGNQRMIHTLADDLGALAYPDSLRTLKLFSRAKYFEKNFGYRRCVLQGVVRVPGDETITYLIDQLPRLRGLVQYDVIVHLMRVTGQNFRDDAAGWKAWWVEQKQTLPKKADPPPVGQYGANGAFYGIPIGAKRVVFALDISRSMEQGGKIDAAKRELCDVIRTLPADVFFGIVAFHGQVHVWQGELMPANETNRKQAIQSVMAQETRGGTSSYDALEAAFGLEPEAIYFVTDGEPRTGKIVVPDEIVSTIATLNHVRRVSIHAIGIGTDEARNAVFGRFLRNLAAADWGEYRSVDR